MRYGFIGLGNLGAHLAASLLRAGFAAHSSRLATPARPRRSWLAVRSGPIRRRPSPSASDAVITCLPSPAISEQVLAGSDGILAGLRPGGAWIEMSTLGRDEILRLAAKAAEKGIATLECAGHRRRAPRRGRRDHRAGRRRCKALFEAHRPALAAMGGEIFHMGPLGSAAVIKVITNMLAFIHLRRRRRGAHAGQARRPRSGPGLPRHQGQLRQQLRARDREPAHPQRQLQHQLHHGPGA